MGRRMKSSSGFDLERFTLSFQSRPSEGARRSRKSPALKVYGWDSRVRMRCCAAAWTAMELRRASWAVARVELRTMAAMSALEEEDHGTTGLRTTGLRTTGLRDTGPRSREMAGERPENVRSFSDGPGFAFSQAFTMILITVLSCLDLTSN